jgi:hypothetical protein
MHFMFITHFPLSLAVFEVIKHKGVNLTFPNLLIQAFIYLFGNFI